VSVCVCRRCWLSSLALQNAAVARLITGTSRCDHNHTSVKTTPLVTSSIPRRVQIRRVLVYKSLNGLTAPYLTDDCQLVANSGRRRLRSADVYTCIIPRTNTRLRDRSFAVAGPRLWNTLPVELRQPDVELVTLRRLLKADLFKCYPGAQ